MKFSLLALTLSAATALQLTKRVDPNAYNAKRVVDQLDANGSGDISRDEFLAYEAKNRGPLNERAKQHYSNRFNLFDTNGDGKVTAGEIL